MNFLVQFGVGLISQAITSGMQAQHNAEAQQQGMAFRHQLDMEQRDAVRQTFGSQFLMDDAPPFPDQAAANLQQMQTAHAQQTETLTSQFMAKYDSMKEEFLADNHLETDNTGPQPRVALDQNGRPVVVPGREQSEQKVARETFESSKKEELSDKHEKQTETLVKEEKETVQTFLANNKPDLGNPSVQGELHKLLTQSQKKALNLSSEQEKEILKHDAYTPEMVAEVDKHMEEKSRMQDEHRKMEEDSPEAGELYHHQQDLAELLRQKKEELQASKMEEMFLTGPPRFASTGEPVDVGKVLPPYLTDALYGMGIYTV